MDRNCESGFYSLPEDCIADVLSRTTPRDACQLSLVAKVFSSTAESDTVWEKFLPSDYLNIIASSINSSSVPKFSSTKDLYLHLSNHPIIIDNGNKSFSLEKRSGKKCFMLAARNLTIAWSDTPQFWTWTSLPDSRFEEVAELKFVWSLDIIGIISTSLLSPDTNYASYLVYKLTDNAYGLGCLALRNHCCGILPPEVFVGLIGEESLFHYAFKIRSLRRRRNQTELSKHISNAHMTCPKEREDGWLEFELGEFYNNGEEDKELKLSLKEVKYSKRGLIVQGIEIKPKEGS